MTCNNFNLFSTYFKEWEENQKKLHQELERINPLISALYEESSLSVTPIEVKDHDGRMQTIIIKQRTYPNEFEVVSETFKREYANTVIQRQLISLKCSNSVQFEVTTVHTFNEPLELFSVVDCSYYLFDCYHFFRNVGYFAKVHIKLVSDFDFERKFEFSFNSDDLIKIISKENIVLEDFNQSNERAYVESKTLAKLIELGVLPKTLSELFEMIGTEKQIDADNKILITATKEQFSDRLSFYYIDDKNQKSYYGKIIDVSFNRYKILVTHKSSFFDEDKVYTNFTYLKPVQNNFDPIKALKSAKIKISD